MRYAILPLPHANIRYDAVLHDLLEVELTVMLSDHYPICRQNIGGTCFFCFDAPDEPYFRRVLYRLSGAYVVFEYKDEMLRPIEDDTPVYVQNDISGVLKYKGKTNENFTSMLINLAIFSSDYANRYEQALKVLDPICGRGTTLFESLKRGYEAYGVEIDRKDTDELNRYFKKYLEFHKYKHQTKQNNLTVKGKVGGALTAYEFALDAHTFKQHPMKLSIVNGNSMNCTSYFRKASFHAIVADLPYGVQHAGQDGKRPISPRLLLEKLAPQWISVLKPGGAMAISFNTHTLSTSNARDMLSAQGLKVLSSGVYDRLSHWVEQAVIRDAVIAVLE